MFNLTLKNETQYLLLVGIVLSFLLHRNQKHTARFRTPQAFSVHSVSKQIMLFIFFQGVNTIPFLE